jgi:expansin
MAAVALAVMVGIGQFTGGQAACTSSALSSSALSSSALSLSALSLSALTVPAGTVSGIATHYVLEGLPNCSYPTPPANGLFVALSPSEYDSAAACGGYLTVTGPSGSSVTVQVIDQCPECATGHIDLSEPAFAELAPLGAGLINVHYQYLADPPLPGPITMEVKQGSSQYWLALLAGNTGNPLASVQVETAAGGWVTLARANYNYWIASSGAGSGPFTVRLTDTQGHTVTVRNIALDPGAVQSTGTLMYGAGSVQTGPAPASSSAAPTMTPTSASAAATTAPAAAKPARPSRSPTARPSGTGPPAAKREGAQAPTALPATVVPRATPTALSTCGAQP